MRILQVTRQFHPCIGGIENVIYGLAQGLRERGHETTVVALDRLFTEPGRRLGPEDACDGIPIRRVHGWGSQRYCIAPGVLRFVRDFDLVHLHSSDFFLDYLALTRFWHRKPLVLTTHGLFFHSQFARRAKEIYFKTATRLALTQVDAVTCISEKDRVLIAQVTPAEKLVPIPNGVDLRPFAGPETERTPLLFVAVGRLAVNKRHERLVRAFAPVAARWSEARLLIAGPDWGERAGIERTIAELGLAGRVELAGEVSRADLRALLQRADFWLSASEYESFGVALVEAMAAGCLPIVQPIPAFVEILADVPGALTADFADPAAASAVLLHAAESRAALQPMRAAVRQSAAKYSEEIAVDRTVALYERILARQ